MSSLISDLSYRLKLDPATSDALVQFSRRRRVLLVLRATAAGIFVLITTMLLVAICDFAWVLSDATRWLMSLVGYGLSLATMWWQGLRQMNESDPMRLARQLETAEPQLREDLLSAVELADPDFCNGSIGFRQRLQSRVADRVAVIDMGRLLPVGLVKRWLWMGLLALTLCATLLFVPGMQFGRRIARAMLPGFAVQRASLTEVTILEPSPPSGFAAEGDSVGVVVRITGTAQFVTLRWRSADGMEGETEMTRRFNDQFTANSNLRSEFGDPTGATIDGTSNDDPGTSIDDPGDSIDHPSEIGQRLLGADDVYSANLSVGTAAIEYQVLAGDAITLWYTLTPLPRPRVQGFEIRYEFPHYAKLSDRVEKSEHGDLQALIGTTATVTVHFDQPVDDATLRFLNHDVETPLEAVNDTQQDFFTSIPILTPGQYQLDASSVRSGLRNPFSSQYTITPVPDAPPIARWLPSQPSTLLVSPLDVLSLAATVSDDLPIDRVVQEFIVNTNAILQTEVSVGESNRKIELQWNWDLLHREDSESASIKLVGGDIVRTRTVAIDRRGQRGESRWIELLVTDEGFDINRHDRLDQLSTLTSRINAWTALGKELGEQIDAQLSGKQPVDFDLAVDQSRQLHESQEALVADIRAILESQHSLSESHTIEAIGRALIELDHEIAETVARWSDVRSNDHPAWKKSREKLLREVAGEARRIGQESNRVDLLARASFAQQLTVGAVADATSLQQSLKPLLSQEHRMPAGRFPRYLKVVIGRLDAVGQLIRKHEDVLLDSTSHHFDAWHRWSESWASRLESSLRNQTNEQTHRSMIKQFDAELANQVNRSMVDGRIASTLNSMSRDVQNQIGSAGDKIRRLTRFGQAAMQADERAEKASNSDEVANHLRDAKLAQADWDRALNSLRGRLREEEALHRSRIVVDLQFASDLKLIDRAIANVSGDGFRPYRDEPAAEIYEKLAIAFQLIEANHHADAWLGQIVALLDAERRLESPVLAKIVHPTWLEGFSVGMDWPIRQLKSLRIPWDVIGPIDESRHGQDYSLARTRITSRRWSNEPLLTADAPLSKLQGDLAIALTALDPLRLEARRVIEQYVLTLAEQAREAAEKVKQAKERIEARPDASKETTESLAEQQREAEQAAMETVESLVNLANTTEIRDRQQRELARDADAAAMQIQDATERAQQQMQAANAADKQQQASESLNQTAETLEELSETLQRTAEHFERAERGEDVSESREQLRQAEEAFGNQDELQDRYDSAQQIGEEASSDPRELMEQLERELQQNEPMQQELSEIAARAAEAAQRTLQQAARDEAALNQSLERSDPTFQEQKLRAARQLANLAGRAAAVDQNLLNAAEQAIGWANQPNARVKLTEAREELQKVVQDAGKMGGENALLSEMQTTAKKMSDAIDAAAAAIDDVQQQTQKAMEENIHQNDKARLQSKTQVERFERDVRSKRIRAADTEKRNWQNAAKEAARRVQQVQRKKRDAEIAKKRVEVQLQRDPKKAESLKPQIAEFNRRSQEAARAEDAAKKTREFAEQKSKEAEQRLNKRRQQKLPSLDKANPAAQLATRMTQQANAELESIREELSELAAKTKFDKELRAPASQARQLAQQQERIQSDVASAADQLQRAARHENRLGQEQLAQQLNDAAQMISDSAVQATEAAARSLESAATDAGRTPIANQDVSQATDQIQSAAEQLATLLAATLPPDQSASDESSGNAQAEQSDSDAEGQQLARTLDELDRAMSNPSQSEQGSPSEPGSEKGGQPENGGQPGEQGNGEQGEQGSPQNGKGEGANQPGQPTASDVSPTLSGQMNAQSQQAARQRQQQMGPPGQGNQPGQGGERSASSATPGTKPGSGEMPSGGRIESAGVDRIGSDWGELRQRRTEDATESRSTTVAPQYRREIEAYFRAVAQRAAEKSP